MGQVWEGALGVGEETNYGVGVAPTRYIAPTRAIANPDPVVPEDVRATGTRYRFRSKLIGLDYSFDWEQWVEPRNMGEVLKFAMGSVQTTTPGGFVGNERRHSFSHADTLPSFSLSLDRSIGSNPTKRYTGSKINSLTLVDAPRDILLATVEGSSQKESEEAALAPDLSEFEYDPFTFDQLSVYIGLNGADPSYDSTVQRVQVVLNNDLITDKITANSSLYIAALPVGRFQITGEFDRQFESLTEYNAFIAHQQLDIRLVWFGDLMVANVYRLEIDAPFARITSLPLPEIAGASEEMVYTVAFEAFYYSTDSKVISITYDNDITSY